jgi:hypothetical protein
MKKYLMALGCACCVTLCFGQSNRWKFRSDNYFGTTSGEMGSYGMLQTVNGLYNGPWFLGLGAGLDYYRFQSVPLFLSVTRDIPVAPRRGGFYLLANGGINLPWYSRDQMPFGNGSSEFHPGVWWNTGLGYRWKLSAGSDKALLITAAYGVKKLREHQATKPYVPGIIEPCPACQMAPVQTYDYDYVNRTWMLNIGFQF